MPSPLPLTLERLERHGLFLIEDGQTLFLWVGRDAVPQLVINVFDLPNYETLHGRKVSFLAVQSPLNLRDLELPPPLIRLPAGSCLANSALANAHYSYQQSTVNAILSSNSIVSKSRIPMCNVIFHMQWCATLATCQSSQRCVCLAAAVVVVVFLFGTSSPILL
jgi:Gelsolin repeat